MAASESLQTLVVDLVKHVGASLFPTTKALQTEDPEFVSVFSLLLSRIASAK